MVDAEAVLYPVHSLCPTQRGCYGFEHYHGAAESQACFLLKSDNSSD